MARKKKLEFTLTDKDRELITKAANKLEVSVATFVRESSINRAKKVK